MNLIDFPIIDFVKYFNHKIGKRSVGKKMTDKAAIRKLLPKRAANALLQEGMNTFELIIQSYPEDLLRIPGFGMASLRAVEAVFFPGRNYIPVKKKTQKQAQHSAAGK